MTQMKWFAATMVLAMTACGSGPADDYSSANETKPDAVSAAYQLCEAAQRTGLSTGCEVQGFGNKVDLRADTTGAEARKMCAGIADMMTGRGFETARTPWTLRILSPYSGDQPIAVCTLR